MPLYFYVGIGYIVLINITSFMVYLKEAIKPSRRISGVILILLPILGGSFGAVLANYLKNTEYRELRGWLHKPLAYLPPIMLIAQLIFVIYFYGGIEVVVLFWKYVYSVAGIIGGYLLIINILAFILVAIRKSAYYFAPIGNYLIPDIVLIPVLLFGGGIGGILGKVIFNFKEDWSCNAIMRFQNFIYNKGMFLICIIQIGLIYYFLIK